MRLYGPYKANRYFGVKMKNLLVQEAGKWMLRGYIVWSVCADLALICGLCYLLFI
tara:strand:+ start:104 stop:268 length:165 start_codon:yes stop_codon:yes gene_type:complete